ncbi:MAG: L,D-transpeptidase [Anaerolineae bacterium]
MRSRVVTIVGLFLLLAAALPTRAESPCADVCSTIPDADILAYPAPVVQQLYPDDSMLYDRIYQKVLDAVDLYDAPNGSVVDRLDKGFTYITVLSAIDGWIQIADGRWVQTASLTAVLPSRFGGALLSDDAPYPIAWIVDNVLPSTEPGAEPPDSTLAILRYTLVNLYAAVEVDGWEWYQIGVDQWVEQRNIARILPVERAADIDTDKWVSVDLYEQVAIAYEGSKPVFATLVSSGLKDWPTNEGLFHVYVRYPRTLMHGAEGNPDFYYLQEVPWTMYFDNDIGLHGTYWHDGFGYRHSHGCVNLSITDALWLYNWASSEFDFTVSNDTGPAVYVYSSGTYR